MSLRLEVVEASMFSPSTPEPEIEWMARIRDGDMEAFRLLVETHQSRVINTVSKILGSDAEAEDLAQQVFIRVWRSASRYQPTAKFTTWLFRITRNLVFNEIRRRKHFAEPSAEPGRRGGQFVERRGLPLERLLVAARLTGGSVAASSYSHLNLP